MKKSILILLLAALLASSLVGCNNTPDEPAEEVWAYDPADANPASDFEYETGDDGGITITKYVGTDTEVVIPEQIDGKDVTVIGQQAFANNEAIISIAMPDSITVIDKDAFNHCTSLTTVVLSDNTGRIRDQAFENCTKLANITLPETLTYIGSYAFSNCASLKHISIPAGCFKTVNEGFTFEFTQMVFAHSGLETIELSEGIEIIPQGGFSGTNIKEIVIPSSVREIQASAFADCKEMEKITLNNGVVSIRNSVFRNTKITEIILPKTIVNLGMNAFEDANQLKKVYFEGNAPENFIYDENQGDDAPYTIYYREGADGFTSPEWNGYSTEIW